jgi:hypothetical protein
MHTTKGERMAISSFGATPRAEWYGDAWGTMDKKTAEKLFPAQVARIRSKFMDGNMHKVNGFTDVDFFHASIMWKEDGTGFMYLTGKKYHSSTAWCWTVLAKILQL